MKEATLLMVSHGAAMWGLCLELGIAFQPGLSFSNCSICEFDMEEGNWHLKRLIYPTKNFEMIDFT